MKLVDTADLKSAAYWLIGSSPIVSKHRINKFYSKKLQNKLMSRTKKFKLYSKLNTNILDHPKIRFNRLKKSKWLRMKNHVPRRSSEFGSLLLAKQLLKAFYGNLSEKQFIRLYKRGKSLRGNTGLNFIKLLERRLDTVLFRMRFGNSFEEVRQFIIHKHIKVNDKIVSSSSFQLKDGDIISVKKKSFPYILESIYKSTNSFFNNPTNKNFIDENPSILKFTPDYLEVNYNALEGIFIYSPSLAEVHYPFKPDLASVMQYYEYKLKI